ncbi:MAG: ASKHA domain-containing protein [Spirochaetaceae bacterium]|nr:ASKHA domain-containing protein [Spirochaetaceae bacterium]
MSDNVAITVLMEEGGERIISGEGTLLDLLGAAGVYVSAPCGGRGKCGKCKVRVTSGNLAVTDADRDHFSQEDLDAGYRLSCCAHATEAVTIQVPKSEKNFQAVAGFDTSSLVVNNLVEEEYLPQKQALPFARQLAGDRPGAVSLRELEEAARLADILGAAAPDAGEGAPRTENYAPVTVYRDRGCIAAVLPSGEKPHAIAIDIGTTTIAMVLVDLKSGDILQRVSVVNKQRELGADVISRMQRARAGDLPRLSSSVRRQISEGAEALCREQGLNPRQVVRFAIAANTTMLHLLLGLSPATLGFSPFTPVTLDYVTCSYQELFEGGFNCPVTVLPGISTYVGADITSGLLFTGLYDAKRPEFFMDIGTNGEMALVTPGQILATATAAGPAFEGGNILWGTGSVPGAISQAKYRDGKFEIKTIGDSDPVGICGSAVVDIVYEGIQNDLILSSGSFNKERGVTELFLAKTPDGQDIKFIQKDVRELQLAKSAIRSGIEALLHYAGVSYDAIGTLYIAGGFGYNLNFASGAGIGLIPQELKEKVRLIGNSALGGAVNFLLDRDSRDKLDRVVAISTEYSLPEDRYFNDIFVENIEFEEAEA